VRIFSDSNLQKCSFGLAISRSAFLRGCSGGGDDGDGLKGIVAGCTVVADASIAFRSI
jgi:hypothetical protein